MVIVADLVSLRYQRRNYNCVHAAVNFIQGQLSGSGQLHGNRMMWSCCKEYGIKMKDASLILHYLDPNRVISPGLPCLDTWESDTGTI